MRVTDANLATSLRATVNDLRTNGAPGCDAAEVARRVRNAEATVAWLESPDRLNPVGWAVLGSH